MTSTTQKPKGLGLQMNLSSLEKFANRLKSLEENALETGEAVVKKITQEVLDEAQLLVPVDTGALRDSAQTGVESRDGIITGAVGYGSAMINPGTSKSTASYAIDRHETMTRINPQAYKWLERTMLRNTHQFQKELADGYSSLLGGK